MSFKTDDEQSVWEGKYRFTSDQKLVLSDRRLSRNPVGCQGARGTRHVTPSYGQVRAFGKRTAWKAPTPAMRIFGENLALHMPGIGDVTLDQYPVVS